ncbi:MAG: class I SAM-dependent methyltransferase, partial [Anaerolineales bacterium]|nr:class I SAM-dependent methyltransferase [Anaerolineales bacterium]
IIDRIPRFVSQEHYSSSFGYEWNRWPRVQFEDENIGKPMAGHTTRMWRSITGITPEQVSGKTIVDFGCGPGRFLDVVRRAGGKAVGIDLSLSVQAARRNFANDPDVLIVQGDVLNPPFRSSVFDGGYTIGVLHHTPDPQKGVQTLVDSIMPRGWVACSVYGKGGFYDSPAVARFRKLNQKLKPVLKYRPALAYSYFSAYVLTPILRGVQIPLWGPLVKYLRNNWLVCLNIPDKRWRILDTFDAITPSIASTHTYEEVIQWMENAGCSDVRRMDFGGVSLSGVKS